MIAVFKILVSGLLVWLVSEWGKKSGRVGGLILSLPITSIIALSWLWFETKDPTQVALVSKETLIFIIPSFTFFILLWLLLTRGVSFSISMASSVILTIGSYALFFRIRSIHL